MKILSVSESILNYLKRHKGWQAGGRLERELPVLSKPATISRVLRSMAEDGIILKDYKKLGRIRYVVYANK